MFRIVKTQSLRSLTAQLAASVAEKERADRIAELLDKAVEQRNVAEARLNAWHDEFPARVAAIVAEKRKEIEQSPTYIPELYIRQRRLVDRDYIRKLCTDLKQCTSEDEVEGHIRNFINAVNVDPEAVGLLGTPLYLAEFGAEPLFLFLRGAYQFAVGAMADAEKTFERLTQQHTSRLGSICLGRTRAALGDVSGARQAFSEGIRSYPDDLMLTMELAASHFRAGDVTAANEISRRVRDKLAGQQAAVQKLAAEVRSAIENKTVLREGDDDIYDSDEWVRAIWNSYFQEFYLYSPYRKGTTWLGNAIVEEISKVVNDHPITQIIEFGAFCAYPMYKLALRYPDIKFVGVDRQELIRELNEEAFAAANAKYIAGDMIEYLEKDAIPANTLLFHTRTACLCYPEFLRQFYRKCAERGVRYIWLYEACAHSRDHLEYFEQGKLPAISVAARSVMMLHDYVRLLNEAGYEVLSRQIPFQTLLLDHVDDVGFENLFLLARLK